MTASPRKGALMCAVVLSLGFLAVWLSLPDQVLVFDGVMFSGIVERIVDEWRRELFNPRHLLFNPAFMLLRDALAACGVHVAAYRLFQCVNALVGVAGLWLFGLLLREACEDDAVAVGGAALLGAAWSYGTRATEGQVYMILAAGGLWTLWAAARLLRKPSLAAALHVSAALAVTILFHAAAVALVPAVLLALWL
ncbi:MAG: hypothetical protein HYZ74_06215, partial [Elusimicrobia bacterium]|nr:hypothetical protein [Elusimicrobiota bacterium]